MITQLFRKKPSNDFRPGQYYVLKNQGVAQLKRIDLRTVGASTKEYAIFSVAITQMTVIYPKDSLTEVARQLSSKDALVRALNFIRDWKSAKVDQTTWNRRYREYMESLNTGTLEASSKVLRNLWKLRESKDLSFGERKMIDRALEQIALEVAYVVGLPLESGKTIIIDVLNGGDVYL